MERTVFFIKEILWTILIVLIYGTIGGFALFLTVLFSRYAYIWAILLTGFFSLFHLGDLRNFLRGGNRLAFFGRLFCLYAISSFIAGFIAFTTGLVPISFDLFDMLVLIFSLTVSATGVGSWFIMMSFFPDTRLYRNLEKTIDGLYALGILWRS